MPEGIAICNTGPLIAFAKVGRLDLLPAIFSEVLIPKAVEGELTATAHKLAGLEVLRMRGFRVADCERITGIAPERN